MKKILVAVDGSDHSNKALDIATSLAKQNNAYIIIFHSMSDKHISDEVRKGIEVEYAHEIEQRLTAKDFQVPLPDETQYARTMLSQSKHVSRVVSDLVSENIVRRAGARLHNSEFTNFETVAVNGDASDNIVEYSIAHKVDTIIMGCRGAGKIQGLLLGSVSQSVVHNATCTVIVVK